MMDGGQIAGVMIVAIVMITSVFKARAKFQAQSGQQNGASAAENQRLREEVHELKDRLKVLERIAVEKENSLSREIEQLRDR